MRHETSIHIPGYEGGKNHHLIRIGRRFIPVRFPHGAGGRLTAEEIRLEFNGQNSRDTRVVLMPRRRIYQLTSGELRTHMHDKTQPQLGMPPSDEAN